MMKAESPQNMTVILLAESPLEAVFNDFTTFGSVAACAALNHFYLGDSTIVLVLFLLMALFSVAVRSQITKTKKTCTSAEMYALAFELEQREMAASADTKRRT